MCRSYFSLNFPLSMLAGCCQEPQQVRAERDELRSWPRVPAPAPAHYCSVLSRVWAALECRHNITRSQQQEEIIYKNNRWKSKEGLFPVNRYLGSIRDKFGPLADQNGRRIPRDTHKTDFLLKWKSPKWPASDRLQERGKMYFSVAGWLLVWAGSLNLWVGAACDWNEIHREMKCDLR